MGVLVVLLVGGGFIIVFEGIDFMLFLVFLIVLVIMVLARLIMLGAL